jgi:hypothetical protein
VEVVGFIVVPFRVGKVDVGEEVVGRRGFLEGLFVLGVGGVGLCVDGIPVLAMMVGFRDSGENVGNSYSFGGKVASVGNLVGVGRGVGDFVI